MNGFSSLSRTLSLTSPGANLSSSPGRISQQDCDRTPRERSFCLTVENSSGTLTVLAETYALTSKLWYLCAENSLNQ